MKKKILSLIMIFSLVLSGCDLLGGAGNETETESAAVGITDASDTAEQTDVQTQPPAEKDMFTADAKSSLQELQVQIADEKMALGTAFLGTYEGGYSDIMTYIQNLGGDFIGAYPWLSEMPESQYLRAEGMELYAVVPADGWTMTVSAYVMDPNNDGLPMVGDKLYEGNDPVLLQGNISDIVPSFCVTAEKDGETVEYFPCLSLENGRLQQNDAVYDFTPYSQVVPGIGTTSIGDRIAGWWTTIYETADGDEILLYLNLSEDGLASYSWGWANSEMGETFGGTWRALGDNLALQLTGGVFDLELGYVPETHTVESVYSYNLLDSDTTLHLRLQDGTSLMDGENGADLTFRCEGMVSPAFDPYDGITAAVADPGDCIGDWYASAVRHDGYEMDLHLMLNADGTASYRYGCGFNGEMCEEFSGTWSADTNGNLTLDMHGGSVTADVTDHYDFDGVFEWNTYEGNMTLFNVSGNLLLEGTENWVIGFTPFDFTLFDGEWTSVMADGTVYRLQLISDGHAVYTVENGDRTDVMYVGYWSATSDAALIDLNLRLVMGEGDTVIRASYETDWQDFKKALILRPTGGMALSQKMSETGEDVFQFIDPNAVG